MSSLNTEQKPEQINSKWFTDEIDVLFSKLSTSRLGLNENDAKKISIKHGKNIIHDGVKESIFKLLLEQFKNLLIVILIIAAGISALIDQPVEALAIIIIVLLAGVLGFVQEYQAEKAIDSLKKMAAHTATVIRNGIERVIPAEDLVQGDVVFIKAGDQIPADLRLIEVINLKTDEASLTGESTAVNKHAKSINTNKIPIGDQKNMVFMGTNVTYGKGVGVVVATGMNTEFGKIAMLLRDTENRKTPLQNNLNSLGKKIGIYAIIIAIIMSVLGFFQGYPILSMVIWGVAVAVAIIPEALPAVVTISIALGVRRMVKKKALIRKLPAVETLGATNIICTDKTGTLTQDEMTARLFYINNNVYEISGAGYSPNGTFSSKGSDVEPEKEINLKFVLELGALCCDTTLHKYDDGYKIVGDPTEGSIVVAAAKAGVDLSKHKQSDFNRIYEIPFSSETKRMTTVNLFNGEKKYVISKGALEVILKSCKLFLIKDEIIELNESLRKDILKVANDMGEKALRVLAIAFKPHFEDNYNNIENNLIFGGLIGMIDPPRPEVKLAIKKCESAGIKPIMITGDNEVTAVAIAKELGIMKYGKSISGNELEDLNEEEFDKVVEHTDVYARISPSHKLKIVNALMKKGNIVAMTGDGVNDAPALKKADIGVAMGIKGTDVSRDAADMILTDDNFASIVSAVEEGRSIFQNIRKYLVYLLGGNFGTVIGMMLALAFTLPIPLKAVQILFINFLMDGLIAIALGVEPTELGLMKNKPRNVKEGILNKDALKFIALVGVLIGLITMGVFSYALNIGLSDEKAETLFFATLIFSRLFNGLSCRSLVNPSMSMNPFNNIPLLSSILISVLFTYAVISFEIFREAFHTVKLTGVEWLLAIGCSIIVLISTEIYKYIKKIKTVTD